MSEHLEKTTTRVTSEALAARWNQIPDEGEGGGLADREIPQGEGGDLGLRLLAELATDRTSGVEWIRAALIEVQEITGAERVFFFDVTGSSVGAGGATEAASEVGQCLLALDYDKEPISRPEAKIPTADLEAAVRDHHAIFCLDAVEKGSGSGGDSTPARGFAVVPLVARNVCHAVVYLDHRFQPISIAERQADRLLILLRTIGFRYAVEKLTHENRSLWSDLLTQREKLKSVESTAAQAPRSRARKTGRQGFKGNYDSIVASSAPMVEIFQLLDRIRTSSAPVLINGESGTGKELVATAIHRNSPRKDRDFVSENCGALTETLLESELFGYVKGAFTGATRDHKGLFELADGGTLFLDEVGDMSPAMQKKLLRSLQEGVVRRVGGKEYIKVDVRIISATNKDLLQEVRRANFREDLYYRLNVINLRLPPLRERREDVPELVEFFLAQLAKETGTEKVISPAAMQLLTKYNWPGNIRELQNEVKRLFAISDARIEANLLSDVIRRGEGLDMLSSNLEEELRCLTLKEALEKVERALIKRALLASQGNKSQVAKQLQIPKTSLYNKISKYQLDREVQESLY